MTKKAKQSVLRKELGIWGSAFAAVGKELAENCRGAVDERMFGKRLQRGSPRSSGARYMIVLEKGRSKK